MLVSENEIARMEHTLNSFRIGLNDWDKSKTFEFQDSRFVSYTIICNEDQFTSIVYVMNRERVC